LNSFLYSLCNPVVQFGLLLFIALVFKFIKRQKQAKWFSTLAIFWILLISTTPFSQWTVHALEKQYGALSPAAIENDSIVYILVLGGGHTNAPDLPPGSQLSSSALARLAEAIRLHGQLNRSKIICSGRSASNRTTQAEMLASAAVDLGVALTDTLQLRSPQNTAEELIAYKKRFSNNKKLIIVTSAVHMPRVMFLCEKEGLTALPAPTDFFIKKDPQRSNFDFMPSALKILMLESALHEYAGIVKVKLSN
jgi:uncharacterized SAM-binding protein YcdF (DUF218 family)